MVHRGDRPDDGGRAVVDGQRLGRPDGVADAAVAGGEAGHAQHHRRRIDADGRCPEGRRVAGGGARAAADVDDDVRRPGAGEPAGQHGSVSVSHTEQHGAQQATGAGEPGVVAVVVGDGLDVHLSRP